MINRDSSKVYIEAKDFTLQDYEERLSICENIFSQEIKKRSLIFIYKLRIQAIIL